MEAGFVLLMAFASILSILIGVFIGKNLVNRRYLQDTAFTQGTLNLDCSESDNEPVLFLGLGVPISEIHSRKYITLDVNVIRKNSHK